MSFKQFIKELNGNRIEGELIKTFILSLIIGTIVLVIFAYSISTPSVEVIKSKYDLYMTIGLITFSLLSLTLRQVRVYRQFNCMAGMMIGMTFGMISGFIPGYLIGATNGMFVGSMFGMAVGIVFGVYNGKSCGIMGIMEGIMAGFMGGLMGAMTAVMMFNDNLRAATVVVSLIGGVIMIMLNYMIYNEMKEQDIKVNESSFSAILFTVILTLITFYFMIFGPKSILFQ